MEKITVAPEYAEMSSTAVRFTACVLLWGCLANENFKNASSTKPSQLFCLCDRRCQKADEQGGAVVRPLLAEERRTYRGGSAHQGTSREGRYFTRHWRRFTL